MLVVKKNIQLSGYGEKHKFKLGLFGDVHWDEKAFSRRAWNEAVKRWKNYPKNSGLICVGDVLTFSNTSTRKNLLSTFQDSTQGDEVREVIDEYVGSVSTTFLKSIRPVEDKLWGFVQGNHSWQFPDGTMIDERIANILNSDYSDGLLIYVLSLSTNRNTYTQLNIVCHHGYGRSSALTVGGPINNRSKKNNFFTNANILATGHDHTLSVTPERPKLQISKNGHLNEINTWTVATGSFVASYQKGKANYVEKAFMPPSSLGFAEFDIWLDRDNTKVRDRQFAKLSGKVVQLTPESIDTH